MFKIFKTYLFLFELNFDDFDFYNGSIEDLLTNVVWVVPGGTPVRYR